MKEYNRTTKRWEEPHKDGSLKKRELCKGNRPHDFQLVLPDWITRLGRGPRNASEEVIKKFYELEEEKDNFLHEHADKLAKLGITDRVWTGPRHRYLECTVCARKDYSEDK